MPRTRRQSAPSDQSISDWESDSNATVPSPSSTQNPSERIPRPPNRFILYRAHAWKERKEQFERDNAVDNMTMGAFGLYIGPIWQNESPEVKAYWEKQAIAAKREHKAKYPNYQYRPNRGVGPRTWSEREVRPIPKRAPCRPKSTSKPAERKEATPSQAERTMKTRSMTRQRQVAEVRTGALERKASAVGRRKPTRTMATSLSPRGDRQQTERTTRRVVLDLTADSDDEGARVEGPTQNQNAQISESPVTQEAILPRATAGREVSPPTARLPVLPVGGTFSPSFDLPVGGGIVPVEQALPAHSQFPDAFNQSFAYSEPQSEWTEHDRPSLWDSPDLPLFPQEILEEHESSSHFEAQGVPDNWNYWQQRQPTFLADFGSGPSQPIVQVDPLLVGWPTCGGQYLGQHLGSFPEPQAQAWTAYT
ncbi:transcription factor [Ganoderma sinense ZZ0214-1]|uniref:Transcription factor n=1 Tax=Ganoderma sinense ZZ0214-1 TaxID=1077348 RepID=A0A2G8RTJ2_9APHY|nr:transcription factor [Ganoderma sinense ZZ0214-1]